MEVDEYGRVKLDWVIKTGRKAVEHEKGSYLEGLQKKQKQNAEQKKDQILAVYALIDKGFEIRPACRQAGLTYDQFYNYRRHIKRPT